MRVRTESCVLPLHHRIPASLSARLGSGREVSYSDHEAVLTTLNLETEPGVEGVGTSGDIGIEDHTVNHTGTGDQSDHTLTQAEFITFSGSPDNGKTPSWSFNDNIYIRVLNCGSRL